MGLLARRGKVNIIWGETNSRAFVSIFFFCFVALCASLCELRFSRHPFGLSLFLSMFNGVWELGIDFVEVSLAFFVKPAKVNLTATPSI